MESEKDLGTKTMKISIDQKRDVYSCGCGKMNVKVENLKVKSRFRVFRGRVDRLLLLRSTERNTQKLHDLLHYNLQEEEQNVVVWLNVFA